MVCPLRFVMIFISATLAALVAYTTFRENSKGLGSLNGDGDSTEKTVASTKSCSKEGSRKGLFSTLINMSTGRYIWDYYQSVKKVS